MPRKKSQRSKRAPSIAPTTTQHEPILDTVKQTEERNPGLAGKLRYWLHRADAGDPDLALLKLAIVRLGRSTFINRPAFAQFVADRSAAPPSRGRSHGRPPNRIAEAAA